MSQEITFFFSPGVTYDSRKLTIWDVTVHPRDLVATLTLAGNAVSQQIVLEDNRLFEALLVDTVNGFNSDPGIIRFSTGLPSPGMPQAAPVTKPDIQVAIAVPVEESSSSHHSEPAGRATVHPHPPSA